MKVCKYCGKEFNGYGRGFCSKSCATSYRNKQKVKDGTLNLLRANGGGEAIRKRNEENVIKGTHPFLKENYSEESQLKASKGISKARKEEALQGEHPWQSKSSRLNNDHALEVKKYEKKGVTTLSFYIGLFEGRVDCFKFGITSIGTQRTNDFRCPLKRVKILTSGDTSDILELEFKIKTELTNSETYKLFRSYETLPINQVPKVKELVGAFEVQRLSERSTLKCQGEVLDT